MDKLPDEVTIARREAALKKMLATPPRPHALKDKGKPSHAKSKIKKGAAPDPR
jgi:hypothetical protein